MKILIRTAITQIKVNSNIMNAKSELVLNVSRLHTTELGALRIKKNLLLQTEDTVAWCKEKILNSNSDIFRKGKNYYINVDGCTITVNAHSFTIITAHKQKGCISV